MVGDVEVYTHPSRPVQRLLKLAERWPDLPEPCHVEPTRHRSARQLRPAEVDALVEGYRSGATVRQLATQFGIARSTVGRHLELRGIDTRQLLLTAEMVHEAGRLYGEGATLEHLAAFYGVSDTTIRTYLLRSGVQLRPGGRRSNSKSA